jgi:hypothetical protein
MFGRRAGPPRHEEETQQNVSIAAFFITLE